jgi:hypothetical protein
MKSLNEGEEPETGLASGAMLGCKEGCEGGGAAFGEVSVPLADCARFAPGLESVDAAAFASTDGDCMSAAHRPEAAMARQHAHEIIPSHRQVRLETPPIPTHKKLVYRSPCPRLTPNFQRKVRESDREGAQNESIEWDRKGRAKRSALPSDDP